MSRNKDRVPGIQSIVIILVYALECSENNILIFLDRSKEIRSCRDVACYVSTVQLPQNEQYQ